MVWIEDKLYKIILEKLPVVTVDAVIVHKDKFLLLKRNKSPVKDEWIFSEDNARTVSIYFLMEADSMNVKLNDDHSEYKWVLKLDPDVHPYLRAIVENSIQRLAKPNEYL